MTEVCYFIISQDYPQFTLLPEEVTKARGKVVSLLYLYTFKFGEYFSDYHDISF